MAIGRRTVPASALSSGAAGLTGLGRAARAFATRGAGACPSTICTRARSFKITYREHGEIVPGTLDTINDYLRDFRNEREARDGRGAARRGLPAALRVRRPRSLRGDLGLSLAETNEALRARGTGVAKNSLHLEGRAIDVRLTSAATESCATRQSPCTRAAWATTPLELRARRHGRRSALGNRYIRASGVRRGHRSARAQFVYPSGVATSTEGWRNQLIAYEDALASFYESQDGTRQALEQSVEIVRALQERLANFRRAIFEARRDRSLSGANDRVIEIERSSASIEVGGAPLLATHLVANVAHAGSVLHLSFRMDPKSTKCFPKVAGHVRIRFPFADSTYVAVFRLVAVKMEPDYFAFTFATVSLGTSTASGRSPRCPRSRGSPMKRLAVIVVVLLVAAGVAWYLSRAPSRSKSPVITAERGPGHGHGRNTRAGTVDACRRANLSSALGGRIATLPVKEGEHVKQGHSSSSSGTRTPSAARARAPQRSRVAHARPRSLRTADVAKRDAERTAKMHDQGFASEKPWTKRRARPNRTPPAAKPPRTRTRVARCPRRRNAASRAARSCARRSPASSPSERRARRVRHAFAARHSDAAGDRPDRRFVPLRLGADRRGRRRALKVGHAGAHHARRVPGQAFHGPRAAHRALRARPGEAGAHRRDRGRVRRARRGRDLLVGYSADVEVMLDDARRRAAHSDPRADGGQPVLVLEPPTQMLEERAVEIGLAQLGVHRGRSGPRRRRARGHARSTARASRRRARRRGAKERGEARAHR